MFKKLKLVLTAQFVMLSLLVYICLSVLAAAVFYRNLTSELDVQLDELATTAINVAHYDSGSFTFAAHPYLCQDSTFHVKPVVQFFDSKRQLIHVFGLEGNRQFYAKPAEFRVNDKLVRALSRPIDIKGRTVGYVQVQMATVYREQAIRQLLQALANTFPFLLLALGACGYMFAGRAIRPVEDTFTLQKRFLADAGHELKTPIAVMKAGLENLAEDAVDQPESCERIARLRHSTERMATLVGDLLLLTRSEQQLEPMQVGSVQLAMVLREAMGEIGDLFEDKAVDLIGEQIDESVIEGNRDAVYTIFSNLIKNAMIYTNAGGAVRVSLLSSPNFVVFTVKDSGIGIASEDLGKVFDRFFRVDQSRTRTGGGSGLGLPIVKALVEQHHGTISVESTVNQGTTFTVTLPKG